MKRPDALLFVGVVFLFSAALAPRGASEGSAVVGLRYEAPAFRGASDTPIAPLTVGGGQATAGISSGGPSGASNQHPVSPMAKFSPLARNRHAPDSKNLQVAAKSPSQTRASARPQPRHSSSAAPSGPTRAGGAVLRGSASWYGTGGPGMYAALPGYIDGTRVQVAVCAFPNGQATCITVNVVTQCAACRWRAGAVLVDLSVPAFKALGYPLSKGLALVTVQVLQ